MSILETIKQGERYPYDAPDSWWAGENMETYPADSWYHLAARGILADLTDRRGIKQEFQSVDEDTRKEIVTTIANIIYYTNQNWESIRKEALIQ